MSNTIPLNAPEMLISLMATLPSPNPWESWDEFWKGWEIDARLIGSTHVWLLRDGSRQVVEVYNLNPFGAETHIDKNGYIISYGAIVFGTKCKAVIPVYDIVVWKKP